ncbi:hypothetical protein F4V43_01805 [Paenibacillus spiritus]|uniref:Uncharacterized protein n=1 Tax=Paenibacillus spiritus TaxID=2496557 RepID=A0A5J5GGB2_9BACL|nr:hypothetical protein [Paenibacillus spiritus]KAA9007246.1 hypothetical protein F4V43_01805 [Paenibacillus spiritus]
MDKYAAIDKYEARITELEEKKRWELSTLEDRDVAKHSKYILERVAGIDAEIGMYVDVIETISSLEI